MLNWLFPLYETQRQPQPSALAQDRPFSRGAVLSANVVTSVIPVRCCHSPIIDIVKSPANETLSRRVRQSLPLIIGVGVVAAFLLRFALGDQCRLRTST